MCPIPAAATGIKHNTFMKFIANRRLRLDIKTLNQPPGWLTKFKYLSENWLGLLRYQVFPCFSEPELPVLAEPSRSELRQLAELRQLPLAGLFIAVSRGFLWTYWDPFERTRCWLITDTSKKSAVGQLFRDQLSKFQSAVRTSAQLEKMTIVPRKPIIGKWMKEGDTGFVYGMRGCGKTWLVDAIATHVSTGTDLQDWEVPEAIQVLLIDGEMPGDDATARLTGMKKENKNLHVLHHEVLFDVTGLAMNLTQPRSQRVITEMCIQGKIKLLILDNLSCLFSGIKENDADEWEKVLNWLLDLRRRRIAVLIVHHSGRSGFMRGTSRREDALFWMIKVEEVEGKGASELGARFQTNFTKQRNSQTPEWTREWTFQTEKDGTINIGCEEIAFDEKVLRLIQSGITSATDLAEELEVNKSTVSRSCQRLINKNLIELNNRQYRPRGFMNKRENVNSA
jgi:hypothetical protein